jgi:hypothetical protein
MGYYPTCQESYEGNCRAVASIFNHGPPDFLPMRQHEVIKSGINRPGSHLQPTQSGAALIRRTSFCFLDGPDVFMAKVNRFAFPGWSFKHSVHEIVNLIGTQLGKLEALWSWKLDKVCVDGEPHNPFGPAFAPGVVRRDNELTKRQGFLPAIGLHGLKYRPGSQGALWGVHPI